jgi:hypothetical protein
MRSLLLTPLLAIVFAAAAPSASAQRMVSGSPRVAANHNRRGDRRSSFFPLAFSDPFYSDYLSVTGYPVASQPPVIILEAPPPPASVPDRSSVPSQSPIRPLLIELQGDRYVQVGGDDPTEEMTEAIPNAPTLQSRSSNSAAPAVAANDLAPAVLVFRDGHREKVSDYTIADGVLYTNDDYYSNGSWNRKIALSSLNLPETLQSNQARGVKFQLPTSPNEVIIRP